MGGIPSSCLEEEAAVKPKLLAIPETANSKESTGSNPSHHDANRRDKEQHRFTALARFRQHSKGRNSADEVLNHQEKTDSCAANGASHSSDNSTPASGKQERKSTRNFWRGLEGFFLPKDPLHADLVEKKKNHHVGRRTHVRGGVLLHGCADPLEHYKKIEEIMAAIDHLHGEEGLNAAGLEFREVLCAEHRPAKLPKVHSTGGLLMLDGEEESHANDDLTKLSLEDIKIPQNDDINKDGEEEDVDSNLQASDVNLSVRSTESLFGSMSVNSVDEDLFKNAHLLIPQPQSAENHSKVHHCHLCHRRLYHIHTNTPISIENRKKFIADGDMYESVAELCQEYAHQVLCEEAKMEWITVEEDDIRSHANSKSLHHRRRHGRPICALVNSDHPLVETANQSAEEKSKDNPMAGRPTIMIATGRGKVRAGIFSRQHLICTSLESSTALPIVREARIRKLNVVIPDPNAHGERFGYETFKKTMKKVFAHWEEEAEEPVEEKRAENDDLPPQSRDLYVLSHSASGSQLARYITDKAMAYVPHIQAIAFTDSTHNIQWAKNADSGKEVYHLLECSKCVYFRYSNKDRDSNWYLHRTGEVIKTDSFWRHRFGNIKTMWAGTSEHCLTNWYAHRNIWEHFDLHLSKRDKEVKTIESQDELADKQAGIDTDCQDSEKENVPAYK